MPYHIPEASVLFTERQEPSKVLLLLEGSVKLSLNSIAGGRLIIGMAGPGEILGLTSVVSGFPYEMTADSHLPCIVAQIPRQNFLAFLIRYPVASMNVARQLSMDHKRACEQLHTVGLSLSAPRKLARLLLQWCAGGEPNIDNRLHCSLTHAEIGEHVGVSRETISRTLTDFKNRGLVEQHGTILIVLNRKALQTLAGIDLSVIINGQTL
jgi:CRP/FNR family cyclic AMP-dependent transcriptional regulator